MERRYFGRLENAFSAARLQPYGSGSGTDLDTIANYLWNTALSEALYPLLQNVEVVLRNSIHSAATALLGTDFWFDLPAIQNTTTKDMQRKQLIAARQAYRKSAQRRLPPGSPIPPATSGQLVAQLNFGFWTGIMNRPFTHPLWPPTSTTASPGILLASFPNAPSSYQSREPLLHRFDRIRVLRNRVFHYEHVWDWTSPAIGWQPAITDLNQQYIETIEALSWINPIAADTVRILDHFLAVWEQGPSYYRRNLDTMLSFADMLTRP